MAVCLLIDIPGGELEQYDEVMGKLEESGGKLGEGQTFHAAGKTDTGFMVVDVWNSREDFDRFLAGRLGRIARPRWSCGVAAALGAPVRTGTHIGAQNGARICSRTGDGFQARQGRVRVAYRMRPSYFGSRRSAADE